MATEPQHGGSGHNAPLQNDLPDKPAPWNLKYTPFVNTYVQDHIDWTVTKPEPLGEPSSENRQIAQALVARMRAEQKARK